MKSLMSGLTVSVGLAIAMPAWAQTLMTPPAQSNAATGSRHYYHHRAVRSYADRLNAEELATLQSGASVNRMPSGGKQLTSPNR